MMITACNKSPPDQKQSSLIDVLKCAWKDTRYCYCFSTFGLISMDCSQACKVFSSWRKQPFWMWLQELCVMARCSHQHKKLSPTWSFGRASSPHLLHGFWNKREGQGTEREQEWACCGVQITSEILRGTLFPRPPIAQHRSVVSVCSQVRSPSPCCFCSVLLLIPSHILLSNNYSKVGHFCLFFIFTAIYKGSCRMQKVF